MNTNHSVIENTGALVSSFTPAGAELIEIVLDDTHLPPGQTETPPRAACPKKDK